MITTDAAVDLSKDVFPLFGSDAFKIRCAIATLVEGIVDDCISCLSVLQLSCLGLIIV